MIRSVHIPSLARSTSMLRRVITHYAISVRSLPAVEKNGILARQFRIVRVDTMEKSSPLRFEALSRRITRILRRQMMMKDTVAKLK